MMRLWFVIFTTLLKINHELKFSNHWILADYCLYNQQQIQTMVMDLTIITMFFIFIFFSIYL